MKSSLMAVPISLIAMLAAITFPQPVNAGVRSVTPPEALLAAESVLYFRFDGLKPHQTAYEKTIFSHLMKDEFGPLADFISRAIMEAYGPEVVADRLIDGLDPAQLLELHRAAKQLPQLLKYLDEYGVVVGLEFARQPAQHWQLTLVFPNGAEENHRAALFGAFRLWASLEPTRVIETKEGDRSILTFETKTNRVDSPHRTPGALQIASNIASENEDEPAKNSGQVRTACWQEGRHLIWTVGTAPISDTLALVEGKRRNLTENAEFKRVASFKRFETYARSFVRIDRLLAITRDDSTETSTLR